MPWDTPEAIAVKSGAAQVLDIDDVTVNFPSTRFCRNYVDDNFLDHVAEIVNRGSQDYGNGAVQVDRSANCGHKKLTGGDAIGFKWNGGGVLNITGYGVKSAHGQKASRSGGYTWET